MTTYIFRRHAPRCVGRATFALVAVLLSSATAAAAPPALLADAARDVSCTAPHAASAVATAAPPPVETAPDVDWQSRALVTGLGCATAGLAGCLSTGGLMALWTIPAGVAWWWGTPYSGITGAIGGAIALVAGIAGAAIAMPFGVIVGGLLYEPDLAAVLAAAAAGVVAVSGAALTAASYAFPPLIIVALPATIAGSYLTYNVVAGALRAWFEPAAER